MNKVILETERTVLRELCEDDYNDLCGILQDEETMYAYEHAFSDTEVREWLDRQRLRYIRDGIGLWAVIDKTDGILVGQMGLTWQRTDRGEEMEIGYLLKRCFWHSGYATEAGIGCRDYAFNTLGRNRLVSIIRDNNMPSQRVAERIGMKRGHTFIKHYYGMDMPHVVYEINQKK